MHSRNLHIDMNYARSPLCKQQQEANLQCKWIYGIIHVRKILRFNNSPNIQCKTDSNKHTHFICFPKNRKLNWFPLFLCAFNINMHCWGTFCTSLNNQTPIKLACDTKKIKINTIGFYGRYLLVHWFVGQVPFDLFVPVHCKIMWTK